ncbi:cytochrome c [Phenylobacterium sp.]|uniref:c-type cytochrome n=1 Tax=Phenylobacterium sp. TaxID=1871053 RepID=UPI0012048654|nr:cytochrome c [Phenylobacterium sp.]THD57604.1 MAG: cytochrome c [Phenylobacterium sp.]
MARMWGATVALIAAVAGAGAGVGAGAATAADPTPAAPVSAGGKAAVARQAHFEDQAAGFKAIGDELKKETPDKAAIQAGADKINATAQDLPSWFPRGSGPEAGVKTAAKAEVWTDAAGFADAAQRLQDETAKLQQVAMAGDLDAIRAGVRATGAACAGCHAKYREPDKH